MQIGKNAFAYCTQVKTVTLGDCIESAIGESAFTRNDALERVFIGNGIKEIKAGAFSYNQTLTLVVLGKSLETVAGDAFMETRVSTVYNLSNLTITNSSDVGCIGTLKPTIYTSLDEGPLVEEQ